MKENVADARLLPEKSSHVINAVERIPTYNFGMNENGLKGVTGPRGR